MRAATFLICSVLMLTGCGAHEDEVRRAADEWSAAIRHQDWAGACDLLAPTTREELEESAKRACVRALPRQATDPSAAEPSVAAYGSSAQAAWEGETLFLSEFGGRWLVWAASCRPGGRDRPYDCDIAGG